MLILSIQNLRFECMQVLIVRLQSQADWEVPSLAVGCRALKALLVIRRFGADLLPDGVEALGFLC